MLRRIGTALGVGSDATGDDERRALRALAEPLDAARLAAWRTLPYAGPSYIYTTRDRVTGSSNPGR